MIKAEEKAAKILLALDIASQNLLARNIAFSLAGRLQAELIGLFVEDEELLASAQYPFALEITAGSASERKLEYADMERSLRAWSTQTQQQLLQQAQQAKIKCSFRTFRGRKTEIFLGQNETPGLLVFSGLRASIYVSQRISHTAYLLVDDNSELDHSLQVIKQLIDEGITDIALIDNGDQQSKHKITQAVEHLSKLGARSYVKQLPSDIPQQLAQTVKELPAAVVLVPASHHICRQLTAFKELQGYLSCPVVVVN